ncbi:asparaginase [Burkholderia glumae]|uniref:Asparaginase n=1 Tax=Burkholderia glumae TaxID=337 RepID=A0AAQ0BVL4_BURGL|nr:asparaginase [Burkholderia glumae]ACR28793.1 L-asparaginase II [Burkholderia glumae BGR1]KHJ59479.1 asparaginase [Burkholderia glumae]MCM2483332.1 asparaginase [Burkholderia glumae]MCM2506649.1 asparaginase [Burkholderia glumae]MCM2538321.1 asparaginase [Burkholderia glumae]
MDGIQASGADAVAVTTWRGDALENAHRAQIAVVDAAGRLLAGFGDPFRVTLARSAAKPAQALAVVETGALERFGFDEADLALMSASHSSEPRHVERARAMLARLGAAEPDLRCGPHPPISEAVARDWIRRGIEPSAVCSNCSGKHAGMLAGARALGAALDGYHLPEHPMQRRVRRTVAELCDLPEDGVAWSIDGCNLPTPAFPLDRLALVYARLAQAADAVDGGADAPRPTALARIHRAMTRHPEMVAGEGRFCTQLMRAFDGALVGKLGADGCYGIGVRASDDTRRLGAEGALGIAAKIEDGNVAVLYMLMSEVLARLRIGSEAQRGALAAFHRPPMRNTKGVETGRVAFPFELRTH